MSAIEAGAADEAVRLLSSGLESGVLAGAERVRFERMLGYARDEAEKSRAELAQLSKDAERASTGQPSVELGRAYLGQQQYDRAIAALRRGLRKGKLQNPGSARVLLVSLTSRSSSRSKRVRHSQRWARIPSGAIWPSCGRCARLPPSAAKSGYSGVARRAAVPRGRLLDPN